MRDAIKPNLLQTLENTPVLVHAGPFGNIAHGNSSVLADLIGIPAATTWSPRPASAPTWAPSGSSTSSAGAPGSCPTPRWSSRRCGRSRRTRAPPHRRRASRCRPSAARREPRRGARGRANLRKQIENIRVHGVSPVVAINAFPTDHPSSTQAIAEIAASRWAPGSRCARTSPTAAGATDLAEAVAEAAEEPTTFRLLYPDDGVAAGEDRERWPPRSTARTGSTYLPRPAGSSTPTSATASATCRCASPRPTCRSRPTPRSRARRRAGHRVREVRASVGAGFIYPICGEMRTMPGLGATPAAFSIDFDDDGKIVGLCGRGVRPGRVGFVERHQRQG